MVAHWAKPGVKCVCVDATSNEGCFWDREEAPTLGKIYTISRVWTDSECYLVCELVELKRCFEAHLDYGEYVGYAVSRFRPIVTRTQSQDIAEHFERFLTEPADIAPLDIPMLDEVGQ